MRIVSLLVATLAVPALLDGQSPSSPSGDTRPRFDTASVKPNRSTDPAINTRFSPGRFAYVNTPLSVLISLAYSVPSERVLDIPEWARREKYDITAAHSPEYTTFSPQQRAMLQRLLEERFSLKARRETRELPVNYYIDPAIMDDPRAADVTEITLSYTFFPVKEAAKPLGEAAPGRL